MRRAASLRAGIRMAVVAGLVGTSAARAQSSTESYVIACERSWRGALGNGGTESIYRCLADDFSGIAPDGKTYDRRRTLASATHLPREYAAVHLDWIQVRVFGSAAVAQGISSWTRRAGTPQRGRWIWTDTWLRRGDRWELVAAEDVEVAPAR